MSALAPLLADRAQLRALRARARAYADFIKLPLRNKIWKGAAGDFMGRGAGSSLDFQDHRAYAPGDDPRHINWQAYARTGQYTMKLFREEVRPVVDVVFDVSASMFFDDAKARRAVELFYFVTEAALRSAASLQAHLLHGPEHSRLAADALLTDSWPDRIPSWALKAPPTGPPALERIPLRPQAMRIFLTDLLYPGAPDGLVKSLAARQGRGVILAPFCSAESHVQWDGNYEFVEPESRTHHLRRVEPGLLKRYLGAYRRHFELWKGACQRYGVVMARVPSDAPFQPSLQGEALSAGAIEML